MEEQILDAPSSVDRKLNYAGFWVRFVAYLIDGVILGAVQAVLLLLGGGFMEPNIPMQILAGVIGVVYFIAMEGSARQATLGKMALGLKVGNERGQAISALNATGRYFSKILSTITLMIGFMMAGWDSKKQALHDKLAGTYVFYA